MVDGDAIAVFIADGVAVEAGIEVVFDLALGRERIRAIHIVDQGVIDACRRTRALPLAVKV